MHLLRLACIAMTIVYAQASDSIIDLKKIANKSPLVVERILGKPTKVMSTNFYGTMQPELEYKCRNLTISIVYTKQKADRIQVNFDDPKPPFAKEVLSLIGVEPKDPTWQRRNVMQWRNIPGFKWINLGPGGNNTVAFIYINTKTHRQ